MRASLVLLLSAFLAVPAAADVIDFETAPIGQQLSLVQGDYLFTGNINFVIRTDSGSKALFAPVPFIPPFNNSVALTRSDGGAFDLLSLDVFAADGNGLGIPLSFVGLTAGGEQRIFSTRLPEFGTGAPIPGTRVALDFGDTLKGVVSVRWGNGAEFHQVDNLLVQAAGGGAGAVPEPATWAMLIAGFGLVGAALRRRARRKAEPAR